MSRTRNKKFFTLPRLIIWALLAMLVTFGLWLFLRGAIVKGMTTGIQNAEAQGYQIGHGGLSVTGFPFTVSANSNAVSVRAPTSQFNDPSKNWAITLDQLTAESATFTPLSWAVHHKGTARVDMRSSAGHRYMFDIAPANINADARMGIGGTLKTAHMDMGPSRLSPLVGNPPAIVEIGGVKANLTTNDTQAVISFDANDLVVSEDVLGLLKPITGTQLNTFNFDAIVYNWPLLEKQGVDVWQRKGGHITVSQASLMWGKFDIVCDLEIQFRDGVPEGSLNLNIRNPVDLIQGLADSGAIKLNPIMSTQISRLVDELEVDENGRTGLELSFKNHQIKYGFLPIGTY